MEIYFEHGKKIKNEEYAYMIFPNINIKDFNININEIVIISNNNIVSAIRNKKLNISEYVFWKSGKFDNIIVDNPCILIIETDYIYISEPTQKLDYITISIDNNNYQIEVSKGYTNKIKINK